MLQRVLQDNVVSTANDSFGHDGPKSEEDISGIPSINDYIKMSLTTTNDRYLHKISHVKIENDDVVIYTNSVDPMFTNSGVHGVCSVTKEQFRIPKDEIKDLITKLLSEDR